MGIHISFSPDGKTLASGGAIDGNAGLWDARTGRLLALLGGHTMPVNLLFSPDGQIVATVGGGNKVRLWDARTGRLRASLPHPAPIHALAFAPDSRSIATGNGDPYNNQIRASVR